MTFKKSISTVWVTLLALIVGLFIALATVILLDDLNTKPLVEKILMFFFIFCRPLFGFTISILIVIGLIEYQILGNVKIDISDLENSLKIEYFGGSVVLLISSIYFGFYPIPYVILLAILGLGQLTRYYILKRNFESQISNLE